MALIRIQEYTKQVGSFQAKVCFNQKMEYDITIRDPFSKEEEERLEWYFEEYLKFPFTNQEKAQEAANSITRYGEELFRQVFADNPYAFAAYRTTIQEKLNTLHIEIVGQPSFHALHWEALKNPESPQPLALQATIVRKSIGSQILPVTARSSPTINLFIVTARPRGRRDVGYRTVSRPLVEILRQTEVPIQVDILRPGTYQALENHLRETTDKQSAGYYHVIHFDVHGSLLTYEEFCVMSRFTRNHRSGRQSIPPFEGLKAFLALEDQQEDRADLVGVEELAALLIRHQIPIAILNACQSGKQVGERETSLGSYLIQAGMQMVVAMGYSVTVSAASQLMHVLYQQLFAGHDLFIATREARAALYSHKMRRAYFNQRIDLEDWLLPVIYQNQRIPLLSRQFTPEERSIYEKRKLAEKEYNPAEPQYGFIGRDIDIQQIEKRLLAKRNLLLIRGMGGAGKTTLLKHLAAWWHETGFVRCIYYFGYNEKAYTLQQIMTTIAQNLYGSTYYTDFQPLTMQAQQDMLIQKLRSENHLLILDNLESISGTHLAVEHILLSKEQDALHSFLTSLVTSNIDALNSSKAYTLVLLGSRSSENWLAKGTFEDNLYDLPGLDPEAATLLTYRILERHKIIHYRQDPDLRKLIKLLDGFPLALEVVLANLAQQTPHQVLTALQTGDITLKVGDSDKRTENILRCIEYSHSNLSPKAQQLLLCLTPFTSIIWSRPLGEYANQLKKQPALANLPLDRLGDVIQEALKWGLISSDPDHPEFLQLQPTLPYFLRNRSTDPEQQPQRLAIEKAFQDYYYGLSHTLLSLINSKEVDKKQAGLILTQLEYENLQNALRFALLGKETIIYIYAVLSLFLDHVQDHRRSHELNTQVLAFFESLSQEELSGSLRAEFISILGNVANHQLNLNECEAAMISYQKVLRTAETAEVGKKQRCIWQANAYHGLGMVAQEQHKWSEADQYYQQALQIKKEYNDRSAQEITYFQLGTLAQEQHKWPEADQYYQQALQITVEVNDRYGQARIYHQMGASALEQHQCPEADRYYQQALQIKREYNDRYGQASTYHGLGASAQEQHQRQKAERYYQQALQIQIQANDLYAQANTYHELGIVVQEQRRWKEAEGYYQRAIQIFEKYNDRYLQANTYNSLGILAQEQHKWQEAEEYYQQALQIMREYNDRYSQARTYHQLGTLAREQGKWQEARELLIQSLSIWWEYQDRVSSSIALKNLALLWHASKDTTLPLTIATILESTVEIVEYMLLKMLRNESGEAGDL